MAATFSQWLKQRRKTLDLTQEALAQKVGCSVVTIKKIEADERRPSSQMAALFAEHLQIPEDEQAAFVQFARTGVQSTPHLQTSKHEQANNLPTPPTPLIGREADVERAARLLMRETTRLVTLVGPPGVGKTRLALQLAAQMLDDFADGAFFVALAPISDPALVSATIASTFQLQEIGPQTPLERLKVYLRDKHLLLVLDNFEQILPAAPQIADLLAACAWVKIVITSRAPLRIRPERQYAVQPLALPDLDALPGSDLLTEYSAISLFVERAQAVKLDFAVTEANASTVAAICTRLDGLPLAIELVSARVKLLPLAALLERLHGRLMLQSDGLRDIEARHRTLNASIDWSYHLLNADEQTLFRRLGVFVGGCTLEAIEAVCRPPMPVIDGVASLLDKSLLRQETDLNGEARFTLLETIREYALEKLAESVDSETIYQSHAQYFLGLAERAEPELRQKDQLKWLNCLQIDQENFRSVLNWCLRNDIVTGYRLVAALSPFWWVSGISANRDEGIRSLQLITAHSDEVPFGLRADAFRHLGLLCYERGDISLGKTLLEESLHLYRLSNDQKGIGLALDCLGEIARLQQEHAQAQALCIESVSLLRNCHDKSVLPWPLMQLGHLAFVQRDFQAAKAWYAEALAIRQSLGDLRGLPSCLNHLGNVALAYGNYEQAASLYDESLRTYYELVAQMGASKLYVALLHQSDYERFVKKISDHLTMLKDVIKDDVKAIHIFNLGYIALRQGEIAKTYIDNYPECNLEFMIYALIFLASVATLDHQPQRAVRMFGSTDKLHVIGGLLLAPLHRYTIAQDTAILRTYLDDSSFAKLWTEGRAMSVEQVVAYALEG